MIRLITSIPKALNAALLVAVGSIVLMKGYLIQIPEIVPWGAEFGEVYYRLCLSLMASYIFYFIVVHVKLERDKTNINSFVSHKVFLVIHDYKSQIKEIKKAVRCQDAKEYFDEDSLEAMFKKLDANGRAPLLLGEVGNYANWVQYFAYHNKRTQSTISRVFQKMPFLDSELVRLLAEIDDCAHFTIVEFTLTGSLENENLGPWSASFHKYSMLCKDLDQYYDRHLKQHRRQD